MKIIFTSLLITISVSLSAQWSNTSNQFYDSLYMPVCTEVQNQVNPVVVKSYPDSGYFVVWEDPRKGFYSPIAIYAQKYDKSGNKLWADNGIPISAGTNSQHFSYSSSADLRNYSVAATDSAGGFYITYTDDSVSTYAWYRMMVQHIRNDGTAVFPGAGYVVVQTPSGSSDNFGAPQLVADGNKGFFVGFLRSGYGSMDMYLYCFRDENGTLKYYGGGQMNINAYEKPIGACANTTVDYRAAYVADYMIYPDLQNGCNVTMTLSENAGGNDRAYTGFNRLWRVKKDSKVTDPNNGSPKVNIYKKDSVITLYQVFFHTYQFQCGNVIGQGEILDGNGYWRNTNLIYGQEHTKGTVVATDGNINVDVMTVNERSYLNNTVSNWSTNVYFTPQLKFDSIPYEYTVGPYYKPGFVGGPPSWQNKLGNDNLGKRTDTLLYDPGSSYFYDYNLASGGNKIFAAALLSVGSRNVTLQEMKVERISSDSFSVKFATGNKRGVVIGREVTTTGFSGTNINYFNPQITVDKNGNALFYIYESGRYVRISPIDDGGILKWGPMGVPIGYASSNDARPFAAMDPLNGTGVIAWAGAGANNLPPNSGDNIYMRHIDNIFASNYLPPLKTIKLLGNQSNLISPEVFLGTTKKWFNFDSYYTGTPATGVKDDYNLGRINVSVYQNLSVIRKYNGTPYLDRNYTIKPENDPSGTSISLRLYFTNTEFNLLKAADPTITDPGMLVIVKQPNPGVNQTAPGAYTPVAGESVITPSSWAPVDGGYYLEITVSSFSNFFIQKTGGALPVQWLNVEAGWVNNNAKISWQVAQQINVKNYTIQHSLDGANFTNVCNVIADNNTTYSCTVSAEANMVHYYRVLQTDIDGKNSFSKIVTLQSSDRQSIVIYPNPAKDHLYINNQSNYRDMIMTDLSGKIVLRKTISNGVTNLSVDHIPSGTYFIRLTGNNGTTTEKFVKN